MEISNKTLALFLVGAIVVSLVGTIISLNKLDRLSTTGFATSTDTGTASLNVQSLASLKFSIDTIDFGAGSANATAGFNNCTLTINASSAITRVGCTASWNTANSAGDTFIIENDGSAFLNVTLNSSDNANDLVGGTAAWNLFQWTVSNNESNSCKGTLPVGTWTEIDKTDTSICTNLSFYDDGSSTVGNDTLRVGIKVGVPIDATVGATSATLTVTGTEFA